MTQERFDVIFIVIRYIREGLQQFINDKTNTCALKTQIDDILLP